MKKLQSATGIIGILLAFAVILISCGGSSDGNLSGTINDSLIPDIPYGLTLTATSSTSIKISWSGVSNAVGYNVYRSLSSGGTYTYLNKSTQTEYTNTGLSPSTTYYYKVSAYNAAGESAQSYSDYARTRAPIPNTPTGVSASVSSSTSITVKWSSVSGATSYHVYRSSSSGGSYTKVKEQSTTTYTDSGLSSGTTYYYKVSASNSEGESSQSSAVSAKTIEVGGPSNGTVTVVNTSAIKYDYINVSLFKDDTWTRIGENKSINNGESYSWTNVLTGVTLTIRIHNYKTSSSEDLTFTLSSGGTKTFTYNGSSVK